MSALISVIVPVYNTERFLDTCIQSILNQTYQDFEIILVDDGSTDGSPEKCDLYAESDPRIQVIHKKNGGQSSARNVGLDVCKGDYISFVDSDDWIEPDMYMTLLGLLEDHGASLAVCARYDAYENSDQKIIGKVIDKPGLFDAYDVLPLMALGKISDFSVCDKLHRRDLWETIRFPEGEIYEDLAVMYKVLIAAGKVVLCDQPFYVYFHRQNSTVTSAFREASVQYPKQTEIFLSNMMAWYPEYTSHAVWVHMKAIQCVMISLLKSDKQTLASHKELYQGYVEEIKKYRSVWSKDPLFSSADRWICRLLLHRQIARLLFLLKKAL